eukprot:TRINITY_DN42158_c0_g1_i1.p1 TRINITY_DN42158_c0_g1~~TRINITY_DN42158_c0_g1_i1.p1  ORF type:complete len:258 (+),score=36.02 TRINITY_DN42158_c0_g1_i1:93-866(+)
MATRFDEKVIAAGAGGQSMSIGHFPASSHPISCAQKRDVFVDSQKISSGVAGPNMSMEEVVATPSRSPHKHAKRDCNADGSDVDTTLLDISWTDSIEDGDASTYAGCGGSSDKNNPHSPLFPRLQVPEQGLRADAPTFVPRSAVDHRVGTVAADMEAAMAAASTARDSWGAVPAVSNLPAFASTSVERFRAWEVGQSTKPSRLAEPAVIVPRDSWIAAARAAMTGGSDVPQDGGRDRASWHTPTSFNRGRGPVNRGT